jgi:PEP-CTERM motif-containing protein
VPPGLGAFPGSGDLRDVAGLGDPGDPSDDPHGEDDDPKSIPEPGTTALMLFGAAWIARRKLRGR